MTRLPSRGVIGVSEIEGAVEQPRKRKPALRVENATDL